MKKILIIICLLIQNSSLFAQTDTLVIHENETKLLTNKYVLELPDLKGLYKAEDVVKSENFQHVNSTLPTLQDSKSTTWLKFILKNKTTRAFVPITIGASIIDNFDLYFVNRPGDQVINLSSSVPYRDTKLIKMDNTFINAIIFPDSTRTIFLRIRSRAPGIIPVNVNSANTFFKNADFDNILVGGFAGITLVMALYNLLLYLIVKDRSYLYYVSYILFLGLTQILLRGYGTNLFVNERAILNNYLIPITRVIFVYSVILFASEFLQLKRILKSKIWFYNSLYAFNTLGLIAVFAGKVELAYDLITLSASIVSFVLLAIGTALYLKGFKPAKYFMIAWGLFLVALLISIASNDGLMPHNELTSNIVLYSSAIQVVLFSIALADKINFYRQQHSEVQALSLAIAKENERLTTQQNILLETEVNARTQQLIETNKDLSTTIENLKQTQVKLIETEKMASLGQLTAGIAHEINNPINFVSSNVKPLRLDFLEILSLLDKYKEAGDDTARQELLVKANELNKKIDLDFIKAEILTLLDGIEEGATRTTEIVQSLRTFSRTDELALKPADINKAIQSTLILLRSTIPPYIEIKTVLNQLPLLDSYPGKINQVLMNLINNSIQAIKAKDSHENDFILIKTADREKYIIIEIQDTGIGMSDEVKQRIFEPFFTTKNVGEGTGLGLSIVFGIIEDHRGSINVQSEPDKGTKFTIRLPKDLEPKKTYQD